ncbi:MAG: hypothetical protein ACREO3_01875 [Arenimonas sp.]
MTTEATEAAASLPDAVAIDPYAPPEAGLSDPAQATPRNRYYVVSAAKYWSLELVTTGLYGLVWMYQHWAHIKRASRGDEWPVMRAIFPVFFMHSLAAEIDQTLRRARIIHAWAPAGMATGAVVGLIAARLFDRVPATVVSENAAMGISMALVAVIAAFKWRIQVAANLACGDPEGRGNGTFSTANIVWLVLFGLFWLLVGLVFAAAAFFPEVFASV